MLLTVQQLQNDGCEENPHMPLFGGFFFCRVCLTYERHFAMSHRGESDCYSVCCKCNTYTGGLQLRNK